jgi:threo-3-hydroxy-L-aspartate ammonia-lyase
MQNSSLAISFADITAAAARIHGKAHRTPILESSYLNEQIGAQLYFKAENFQRMGAFKFRGACNAIAKFTPEQRKNGVIAFSSGNHAQAIALSAKLAGIAALIVMPQDAPATKIQATKEYGAQVITFNRYTQDREALTQQLAKDRGMTLIPPYDHVDVMAGQGTTALELIQDAGHLDLLLVCLGGGGLLAGCAVATKHLLPHCDIIGVEPEAGNDVQQSLAKGSLVKIDTPKTIADGAQTQMAGHLTFPIMKALVSKIETASDQELVEAMKFFASRMKIVVEPTGALAAALAMRSPTASNSLDLKGKKVGVIISGGNTDLVQFGRWIGDSAAV